MRHPRYRRLQRVLLSGFLALLIAAGLPPFAAPLPPAPAIPIAGGPGNQNGGGG